MKHDLGGVIPEDLIPDEVRFRRQRSVKLVEITHINWTSWKEGPRETTLKVIDGEGVITEESIKEFLFLRYEHIPQTFKYEVKGEVDYSEEEEVFGSST